MDDRDGALLLFATNLAANQMIDEGIGEDVKVKMTSLQQATVRTVPEPSGNGEESPEHAAVLPGSVRQFFSSIHSR